MHFWGHFYVLLSWVDSWEMTGREGRERWGTTRNKGLWPDVNQGHCDSWSAPTTPRPPGLPIIFHFLIFSVIVVLCETPKPIPRVPPRVAQHIAKGPRLPQTFAPHLLGTPPLHFWHMLEGKVVAVIEGVLALLILMKQISWLYSDID